VVAHQRRVGNEVAMPHTTVRRTASVLSAVAAGGLLAVVVPNLPALAGHSPPVGTCSPPVGHASRPVGHASPPVGDCSPPFGTTRPGHGHGDDNHDHTGPPGQR
jgi:hypothetical protein